MDSSHAASDLAAFIARHDRLPLSSGRRAERSLAGWVDDIQVAHGRDLLDQERIALFDETLPGWSQPYDDVRSGTRNVTHHRRTLQCVDHFQDHGRLPTKTDRDAATAKLGEWLRQQRNASRGVGNSFISPARIALLDRLLPGWDTTKSEVWLARARDIEQFVDEHGHLPRIRKGDPEQSRMYFWILHTRYAVFGERRGGAAWQRTYLDRHLPGWDDKTLADNDAMWEALYQVAVAYVAEHKTLPRGHVDAPEGARISAWLHRTLRDTSASARARHALLDRNLPGWRDAKANAPYTLTRDGRWSDNLEALRQFIQTHGRLPGARRGALPAERYLRAWMVRQRITATEARAHQLDIAAPGWRDIVPHARPNVPIRGGLDSTCWMAPRLGDVLEVNERPALVVEPSLNPTDPVGVFALDGTTTVDSEHRLLRLRWPKSVRIAGTLRDRGKTGQTLIAARSEASTLLSTSMRAGTRKS